MIAVVTAEYVASKTITTYCIIPVHVWVSQVSYTASVCPFGSKKRDMMYSAVNVRPVTYGSNTVRTQVL